MGVGPNAIRQTSHGSEGILMRYLLLIALMLSPLAAKAQDGAAWWAVMEDEGGGDPYTPESEAGLSTWMCADDGYVYTDTAGTTGANQGESVRRWNARDANADYATGEQANRLPEYSSDSPVGNIVKVIASPFTGADIAFASTNIDGLTSSQTKVGVYAVWKDGDPLAGDAIHTVFFHSKGNSTALARIAIFSRLSGVYQVQYRVDDADAGTSISHGAIETNRWYISSMILDYSAQSVVSYLDGQDATTNTTISATSDADDSLLTRIFSRATNADRMPTNSALAEVVLVQGDQDRRKMEGYLAWARGLEGNLPIGHPYKNAPPTQ